MPPEVAYYQAAQALVLSSDSCTALQARLRLIDKVLSI